MRSEVTIYRAGYNTLLDRLYDVLNRKARRNETGTGDTSSGGILSGLIQRLVDKTGGRHIGQMVASFFLSQVLRWVEILLGMKR